MSHKCPWIAYEKIMEIVGNFDDFHGRYWRRFEGKRLGLRQVLKTNVGRITPFCANGQAKVWLLLQLMEEILHQLRLAEKIPLCYNVKKESRYIVQAGLPKKKSAVCRFAKFVTTCFFGASAEVVQLHIFGRSNQHQFWGISLVRVHSFGLEI